MTLVVGSNNCSIYDVRYRWILHPALCFLFKVLEEGESVAHDFSRRYRISPWKERYSRCVYRDLIPDFYQNETLPFSTNPSSFQGRFDYF